MAEQVVAGADAGAAIHHRLRRSVAAEVLQQLLPQLVGRKQGAIGGEVGTVGVVGRSGNVTGHPVDRFHLAFEAFGRAGVEQQGGGVRLGRHRGVQVELQSDRQRVVNVAAARVSLPLRAGRPSAIHFAHPPSSTATF